MYNVRMGYSQYGNKKNKEEVTEYLEENPGIVKNYIDQNPEFLNKYVVENIDLLTLKEWLENVKEQVPSELLKVRKLDFLKEKNTKRHHTDKYINTNLVLRRSDTFNIDIYFNNRAFLPKKDNITFEFSIGPDPTFANGTKIKVPVAELKASKWSASIAEQDDANKKVSLLVNIPSNAIIGKYDLSVLVESETEGGAEKAKIDSKSVIVIFNPFSPGDVCYMENNDETDEYVLNDRGLLYRGSYRKISSREWIYAQFEEGILGIALKLLRENPTANKIKSLKKRSSPVYCSRVLSAMINSQNNNGVLDGRWDGKYSDGISPSVWKSSETILNQWNKEKKSVQYGQCWVFAGVMTTVLRAIGIPARPVTNFSSAHDTDFTLTIDKFMDEDGNTHDEPDINDSIWNFHVWNETWFARPDLVPGYDGWQAVDATPQEESEGVMQCGPCPIKAIKKGEVYIGKDTEFIFSEVNADVVYWRVDKAGDVTGMIKRVPRHVGRKISTKAVGSQERNDVTGHYKFAEGTPEEREAFERAFSHGVKKEWHEDFMAQEETGILIDIKPVGEAITGHDVKLQVEVKNDLGKDVTVQITTVMYSVLNTGKRSGFIKQVKKEAMIPSQTKDQQTLEMLYGEYGSLLVDENIVSVITTVRINDSTDLFVESYDLEIESPKCLQIMGGDNSSLDDISLSITNPLPVALTGGVFNLDSPGVFAEKILATGPIAPGETYRTKTTALFTFRQGEIRLIADFDSPQLRNVNATKDVEI